MNIHQRILVSAARCFGLQFARSTRRMLFDPQNAKNATTKIA
jgi:hypothetical protein